MLGVSNLYFYLKKHVFFLPNEIPQVLYEHNEFKLCKIENKDEIWDSWGCPFFYFPPTIPNDVLFFSFMKLSLESLSLHHVWEGQFLEKIGVFLKKIRKWIPPTIPNDVLFFSFVKVNLQRKYLFFLKKTEIGYPQQPQMTSCFSDS